MPFDSVGGDHYLGERPSESTSLTRSTDRRYGTATFVEPNFAPRQGNVKSISSIFVQRGME